MDRHARVDWTDSWIKSAPVEPDGIPGWPKGDCGGGESNEYSADSLLGEAMALRPVVLMAHKIKSTPHKRLQPNGATTLRATSNWPEKYSKNGIRAIVGARSRMAAFGSCRHSGLIRKRASGPTVTRCGKQLVSPIPTTRKITSPAGCSRCTMGLRNRFTRNAPNNGFVSCARACARAMTENISSGIIGNPLGRGITKTDGSPKHWVGVHPNTAAITKLM